MKLIIDSNIIISALIRDSKTRELILESGFELYYPKASLNNLEKYKEEIIIKAGINNEEFEKIYHIILSKIIIVENIKFLDRLDEAKNIMGHIDIEDVPFIALALSVENDGIWTDDSDFNRQDSIKVWKTEDILKSLM
ncbi:MAG: PIN domain-containing protein [Nanoarchaeota archaeon]|mgnify:FL=1